MLKDERQAAIMALLEERSYLSVDFLCKTLHYSPATLRRDIRALVRAGLAHKSYGGIALGGTVKPLAVREHEFSAEKAAVAACSASLLRDGDTVFVAGSSSTAHLLRPLAACRDITVVTTDLQMALALERLGVRVFSTGGALKDGMCVGPMAADALRRLHYDIAFFSVAGLSEDGELSVFSEAFGLLLQEVIARADRAVCLCIGEKLGRRAFFSVGDLSSLTHLISDVPLSPALTARYPSTAFLVAKK